MVAYIISPHPRDDPDNRFPIDAYRWWVRSYDPRRPERIVLHGCGWLDQSRAMVKGARMAGDVADEPKRSRT